MRIGDLTWSNPTARSSDETATTEARSNAPLTSNREIAESVKVSLSERAERAQQSRNTQDIDDSDLPQLIKQLLKQIRELKQQIAELQQRIADIELAEKNRKIAELTAKLSALMGSAAAAGSRFPGPPTGGAGGGRR